MGHHSIGRFFKKITENKSVRFTTKLLGIILILVIIFVSIFVTKCGSVQKNFVPISEPISKEVQVVENSIANYTRTEETTYLTYPEWYLVFNPQEYADFLASGAPSHFAYFGSIRQFWSGYCQVYGITKQNYEFNPGDHLVEVVIGTSFSVEYFIKGFYENIFGRISEITAGGAQTNEDVYAAKIAKDYGEFIPTEPWYAYPFGKALAGLWSSDTGFWGPHIIRKWERKIILSLEYGIKALYAKLIGLGTHATYGIAATEIYARVANIPPGIKNDSRMKIIKKLDDDTYIVTVPHYQGFTDTVPALAKLGIRFLDVAGNDEILLVIVAPEEWHYDLKYGNELFTMSTLIDPKLKRVAIQVPIKYLSEILNELDKKHLAIKHLFDY